MDLIFSSDENIIESVAVREPFGTSDHNIIEFDLVARKCIKDKHVQHFNFHKANYKVITEAAVSKHWEEINSESANDLWLCIKNDIVMLRNEFIPKASKRKFRCKWTTKTSKKCRRAKIKAWNRYKNSGKEHALYENYKKKLCKSVKANEDAKKSLRRI